MLHSFHGHLTVENAEKKQITDAVTIFAPHRTAADRSAEIGYRIQGARILDGALVHVPDCAACRAGFL